MVGLSNNDETVQFCTFWHNSHSNSEANVYGLVIQKIVVHNFKHFLH
jgi:hypothetical protein